MASQTDLTTQTEAILGHHLQALAAKDLDAVLSDYTDDTILFTPTGVFTGLDQLRGFFSRFIEMLTPEFLGNFKIERQDIQNDYAYITWASSSAMPFGTDTFVISGGKIVMQSFAAFVPVAKSMP